MSEEEKKRKRLEDPRIARAFRLELKAAREKALADAEAFDGIIQVIERYGRLYEPKGHGLDHYRPDLKEIAYKSPLAKEIPLGTDNIPTWRTLHQSFESLFDLVKEGRNDAMHSGARARTLTTHTIELALILEDGLLIIEDPQFVSDFMVRNPICAELWQPVSFARQIMLTYAFSYLPIEIALGEWRLLSDAFLAQYLQSADSNNERKRRLEQPLRELDLVSLIPPEKLLDNAPLKDNLDKLNTLPCLVFRATAPTEIAGILTPFDIL